MIVMIRNRRRFICFRRRRKYCGDMRRDVRRDGRRGNWRGEVRGKEKEGERLKKREERKGI